MSDDAVIVMLILLAMSNQGSIQWGGGWVWPIPAIDMGGATLMPLVSQEFRGAGAAKPHYGVDLMYARTPRGVSRGFYVPDGPVPILAARDGVLWSITETPRGWAVVVDHGRPFATFYQHLQSIDPALRGAPRSTPIRAGQPLGVMGSDPLDSGHVRHLHFAVWYLGSGDRASVDPERAMRSWRRAHFTMPAAEV